MPSTIPRAAALGVAASLSFLPFVTEALQQPAASAAAAPVALTRVTVIDPQAGSTQPNMTVLVRDGRVASVTATGAALPGGVQQFDAAGKFLIPGLWDMHVHLSYSTGSALPVYIANGVTGVRDLGSDLAQIDDWRAHINAGTLIGPRIIRAGPMVNGQSFNQYQLVTNGPEQARGIVRTLKQVGVDFVKIHRRVPRDDYFAIVDETKKQGLTLVGHIPMTVRPEEASDAGQLIEHTETLFEGTFSEGMEDAKLPDAIRAFRAKDAAALFARFVRNQTPVTPMIGLWRMLAEPPPGGPLSDPRLKYTARSRRELLASQLAMTKEQLDLIARRYLEYRETVRMMNRAGVLLLAGTDSSVPPRIPGFALHEELMTLVDAGLTPLEALRTATVNAARILKKTDDFGTVAPGKVADMVVLDANPLEDIRNTQRIAAVIARGKLLRRGDLDGLLKLTEELASRN